MGTELPELFLFPARSCRCQEQHGAPTAAAAGLSAAAAAVVTVPG